MNHESEYSKEITQKSFQELQGIAGWLNIHGHYPIVTGGWAAYYYTKGLGSRDIDVILPKTALPVLKSYCESHGYKINTLPHTRILFSKKIGSRAIDVDVFTFDHRNRLAKNPRIEIPWSLAKNNSNEWKMGRATAKVVSIELLLLYKVAAMVDREHKIQKWALQPLQKQHLHAKIWKDQQDISSLLKQGINEKKLEQLLKKTKFKKEYQNALKLRLNP